MRLRLLLAIEYDADPKNYNTEDPRKAAEIDHRNFTENHINLVDFLEIAQEYDKYLINIAVEPVS